MSLNKIARTLASNVAKLAGDGEKTKITLDCFYYTKYGTFDVNYHVNDSGCRLGLLDIKVNDSKVFPECREVRKLAIEELDRVIKSHYKIEKEHAEMLSCLKDIVKWDSDSPAKKLTQICDEAEKLIKKAEGK
jgi:hypothetical protein